MAPFLIPIMGMLADKGLDLLSGAIEGGADKAIELVKDKTGIDLNTKKELSSEDISKLNELQLTHKEKLEELKLRNKIEDNRHEEHYANLKVGDVQNARGAAHLHEMQTITAGKIYDQTMFIIPILLVADTVLVLGADWLKLDAAVVVGVSNLIGIALNNAYRERQSILEFLFGSSVGSKLKDN